jgi:vitamin B12 transporter
MKKTFMVLMAAGITLHAAAQTDSSTLLNEVVVTANRFPQKQKQTGKVMTVIPRSELEKNTGRNLGEILGQYAGLTIPGSNNNRGTNLDVYIRGAGLGNALILVDGLPLYDAASISSAFDLNFFSPDMIERVEILKGGQSTIYGSDAVAGVINLILRKPTEGKPKLQTLLSGGSFGTITTQLGLSGTTTKQTGYRIQYDQTRSRGISTAEDTTGLGNFDRDGFQQHQLTGGLHGKWSQNLQWKLSGQFSTYKTELDASGFRDDQDHTVNNRQLLLAGGLNWDLGHTRLTTQYSYNTSNRDYLDDSLSIGAFAKYSESRFLSRSHFAELFAKTSVNQQLTFVYGVDARWQSTRQSFLSISSFGPYQTALSPDSAQTGLYSLFASGVWSGKNGLNMEAGIRYNHHSMYGNNLTYTLNPSFVTGNWKWFLNISTAFKAPTLYQLYDGASGLATLKPERSRSYEAGAQLSLLNNHLLTRLVAFRRNLRDGIDYSFASNRYFNNNRSIDKGLEAEILYRKGKWNLNLNYTWLDGQVETIQYVYDFQSYSYLPKGDTSFNYQFRRPAHTLNLNLGGQLHPKIYGAIQARYVGRRMEGQFMAAPVPLPAYVLVNANAEWKTGKKSTLFLTIGNLFNKRFTDILGFVTRPLNYTVGVRLNR